MTCLKRMQQSSRIRLTRLSRKKREKFKDLTPEERAQYREQKKKVRQRNAENVMNCGCCSDNSEFELGELVDQIEGTVAKALGFYTPSAKVQLIVPLPNRPYRPHRRKHNQF